MYRLVTTFWRNIIPFMKRQSRAGVKGGMGGAGGQRCRFGFSTVSPSAVAASLRSRSAETRVMGLEPAA